MQTDRENLDYKVTNMIKDVPDFAIFAESLSQLLFIDTRRQSADKQLLATVLLPTSLQPSQQHNRQGNYYYYYY